ncbi:NUDIX domain-containing protein [Paenibacillus azoreducens]|uniref:NUDIX hydrolase n=1 Tax=Paenibacillus azoreducens TaxID=116718 RepID=A0A919Y8S5_9BACL|nr:NUDIX domain-containing protein [Paenibacillus azoreducens]GIO47091.1 NUDIX hydrolase [Paenibacillus azoreducens]
MSIQRDAAGFVLFDELGRVLLVHRTYGEKKWGIPGGLQESGEPAWETAIRECKEEIGINISLSDVLLSGMYFRNNSYVFIFLGKWFGSPIPDGVEIDQIGFFPLDQLPSPISNFTIQRIKDAADYSGNVVMCKQETKNYKLK